MFNKLAISTLVFSALSCNAHAATLDDIVSSFALPANSTNSVQDWSTTDAMHDIHWKPKSPQRNAMTGKIYPDSFSRLGKVDLTTTIKNHTHIAFTATANGDKNIINFFAVEANGVLGKTPDGSPSVDLANMKKLFSKPVDIKVSRPSCNSFGFFSYWDLYTITLPNKKPVFISVANFYGGDSNAKPTTTFTFQNKPFTDDDLMCNPAN